MGVENWQARWHAPQKPQEKRGFSGEIERATSPKKWHALARSLSCQLCRRQETQREETGVHAHWCALRSWLLTFRYFGPVAAIARTRVERPRVLANAATGF